MLRLTHLVAHENWTLEATFSDGARRVFDVRPLLGCAALADLRDLGQFRQVRAHGYFVEWPSGADLSADTLYLGGRSEP
jgi:hypothetical protein